MKNQNNVWYIQLRTPSSEELPIQICEERRTAKTFPQSSCANAATEEPIEVPALTVSGNPVTEPVWLKLYAYQGRPRSRIRSRTTAARPRRKRTSVRIAPPTMGMKKAFVHKPAAPKTPSP